MSLPVTDREEDSNTASQKAQQSDGFSSTETDEQRRDANELIPDGGRTAWLVVLGGFCVSFCSFGWLNSIGVFQEYYEHGPLSNLSSSTISWIPSLQIFFMNAMGPLVGVIYDRYGTRYLLLGGSLLHVVGLMMASLATEYYQFLLAQGVCSAIGAAAVFQPCLNTIPGWFTTRRGTAYGVLSTGSSVGGVVFPIMISRLIPTVGYPWSMRIAAFLILALLAIANCTVRVRIPPTPKKLALSQFVKPFKEIPYMGLVVGVVLLTFGIYIPINYIQVEAIHAGMKPDLSSYLLPILNAASLFGRLSSGVAADKIGRFNAFIISCGFAGLFTLVLWLPGSTTNNTVATMQDMLTTSDGINIAFAVLFGFFSGAYISLLGALVAAVSPPHEMGIRMGVGFLLTAVPGLVTNPIAGAILGASNGSFVGMKVYAGVMMLAGTGCVALSRGYITQWKLKAVY